MESLSGVIPDTKMQVDQGCKAGLRTREWRILIRRVHAFP
jgi:hypothetical protein